MRHRKKGRKLGTDTSHTKAMKKSLTAALLANDRIKTTLPRAKEIRGEVDRVITWAKRGDIHSRRLAIAKVGDKEIVREIFEKVDQGMFAGRNGGYTRIFQLGNRKGDNARMVIIELVTEPVDSSAAASASAADKKSDKKSETKAKRTPKGKEAERIAEEELAAKFKFDDEDEDAAEAEDAEAETADAAEEVAEDEAAEEATETEEAESEDESAESEDAADESSENEESDK